MLVRSIPALASAALLLSPSPLIAHGSAAPPATEPSPDAAPLSAPTIITIRPGAGFDTAPPPSSSAQQAPGIAGPPGAAPAQELIPFEEALARRRAANNPIPPPENPSRQWSGLRCVERADGSTSCSQSSSIGSSPEARVRAEAAARAELDRLNNPPPR